VNAANPANASNIVDAAQARAAILDRLAAHGHPLSAAQRESALVGLGVNSVTLVQVLSRLEDEFDLDFDTERLFAAGPVSVALLEAELVRLAGGAAREFPDRVNEQTHAAPYRETHAGS
jgi:acyl carrier protein